MIVMMIAITPSLKASSLLVPKAAIDRLCGWRGLVCCTARNTGTSAVFHSVQHLRKPMDLSFWLGANRSDAQWHREDLQRRQGGKGAVLRAA
ncbi:MAG: hypothetical protein U1E95_12045 [Rubrivivax sp.]